MTTGKFLNRSLTENWPAVTPSSTGSVSQDFQPHPHLRNWCRCHCPDCLAESRLAPVWPAAIYHSSPTSNPPLESLLLVESTIKVEICQRIGSFFCRLTFPWFSHKVCLRNLFLGGAKCEQSCQQVESPFINFNFPHSSSVSGKQLQNLQNLTNPSNPLNFSNHLSLKDGLQLRRWQFSLPACE